VRGRPARVRAGGARTSLRGAFLGEMRGHSRARVPPHPPDRLLPHREKGVLGVLMPETEMVRRGLPTNPPLRGRAHLRFAPVRGHPARVRAGGARTSLRGAFLGEMRGHSRARVPPHPPDPLLPNWEKGKVGRPDA